MADDKREAEQRLKEIELLKEQARDQGLSFSCLTEKELLRKIKGKTSNSPYIYAQSWTSGGSPGASAFYRVHISNPDPNGYYPVFASIYFGVANYLDNTTFGEALADGNFNGDPQWPYMSSRPFSIAAGGTASETFNYTTPSGAAPSTYVGNCAVWRGSYHDQGTYFDRGLFYITLT